ncbi:MAG: hypothetical protein IT326_00340 [Anaerolineae bacterium]|nr:hypothetical protein [Anaerolineae bacterium]
MCNRLAFAGLLLLLSPFLLTGCTQPAMPENAEDEIITEITPLVEAFLTGDISDRRELVQFLSTACTAADGLGGPPKCAPGEAEGTLVEVFPVLESEGYFARPSEIDRILDFTVDGLYAVYRPSPGSDPEAYWPTGEYALLFERQSAGISLPITAFAQDGRLVRLAFSYPAEPAALLDQIPTDQVLLDPVRVRALTEQLR